MGHEGKCSSLHGHSYKVEIEAQAALDTIGRVIDFSVLKDRVGGWLDREWDHAFLLFDLDHETRQALSGLSLTKIFLLPVNPTAENIAAYLLETVCPSALAGTGVLVVSVTVHETENCQAEARL
jgi:6-pyruvoyltetrahydropterin/6-carboxytetrahydropterin synthase